MATIKSIEEKAKAYDGLIKRLKDLKFACRFSPLSDTIEEIFPELKESEDERMVKFIKNQLFNIKKTITDNYKLDKELTKAIDWLEKQGKKTKPIEDFNTEFERQVSCLIASAMNKDYEYTKDFVKWTSDALLNYAKLEIEKNSMGISEATKKKLEDNLNKALKKETPESWNEFLDEQGKQKYADKVEPTWCEEGEPLKELAETYLAVFDKHFPILPTLKGKQLADYKNFLNQCQQILGLKYWGIHPTQARLFEKLSLLWATWGAEHLKGLGQTDRDTDNEKQEWSEEDEDTLNTIINHFKVDIECTDEDDVVRWLKSLKDRVQPQPKQEWSKEDTRLLDNCISLIEDIDCTKEEQNWLKSLKNKVQPQPKKEWSEEDIETISRVISIVKWAAYSDHSHPILNDEGATELVKRLKSLKERYTWKPNDEQLKLLKKVIDAGYYTSYPYALETLYEQLRQF